MASRPLAKSEADAYSLDDLLEILHETDLVFGLYDTEGEPIDQKGSSDLLNAGFDAAFPNPLDTVSADASPAPVVATNSGQRFEGEVYPLSGFDRMLFLIAGTAEDEPETVAPTAALASPTPVPPATTEPSAQVANTATRFIFQTDEWGCLTYVSGTAQSLFAMAEGSPVGLALEELCAPDDLAAQARIATALAARTAFEAVDVAMPVAGDQEATVRLSAIPVSNELGRLWWV